MSSLHLRMPVVLQPDIAARWLAGEEGILEAFGDNMPAFRVNNARNESPDLVEPVGEVLNL